MLLDLIFLTAIIKLIREQLITLEQHLSKDLIKHVRLCLILKDLRFEQDPKTRMIRIFFMRKDIK
jgi:hypothetical protein